MSDCVPPFPPYTAQSAARRFPTDTALQQRLRLLAVHCTGPPNTADYADRAVSRATLYRWQQRWEAQGIRGLMTPATAKARPLQLDDVVDLLRTFQRETPFLRGCRPAVAACLPHVPDAAERGRLLTLVLQQAIAAADAWIAARYGVPHLLTRCLVQHESVKTVAHQHTRSASHLYQILRAAQQQIQQQLADLATMPLPLPPWAFAEVTECIGRADVFQHLNRALMANGVVSLVGLSGVGKTTLAAALAQSWADAGWNVIWARYDASAVLPVEACLHSIYVQLTEINGITHPLTSVSLAQAALIQTISAALGTLPLLLILDDAHLGMTDTGFQTFLNVLLQRMPPIPSLLIGQQRLAVGCEIILNGLSSSAARQLHVQIHGQCSDEQWAQIYQLTGGNPELLRLTPSTTALPYDSEIAFAQIRHVLTQLPQLARRALLWLAWWERPLHREHPAVRASGLTESLQLLLEQHLLLSLHHDTLTIHDMVRTVLFQVIPADEQAEVCRALLTYAEQHCEWEVAYRCGCVANDSKGQLRISKQAAQLAAQQGEFVAARRWWEHHQATAQRDNNLHALAEALLGQATAYLRLHHDKAAMDCLAQVPDTVNPVQRWWKAFYELQARALAYDHRGAEMLVRSPPLSEPAPAAVGVLGSWQLTYERGLLAWRQERLYTAWRIFQSLARPPISAVDLWLDYYTLGATVALSRGRYRVYGTLAKARWTIARQRGNRSQLLWERLRWGRAQYETQRYAYAAKMLREVRQEIEPSWIEAHRAIALYLGLTYYDLGHGSRFDAEIAAYQAASDAMGLGPADPMTLDLRALACLLAGDYPTAKGYLLEASDGYEQRQLYSNQAVVTALLVAVALCQGHMACAYAAIGKTLEISRRHHRYAALRMLRLSLGDWCMARQEYAQALRYYQRAARHAREQELWIALAEAQARSSECLNVIGQHSAALAHSSEAIALIRSSPLGLRVAPRIWLAHAQTLEHNHQVEAASRAWHTALDHVRAQLRRRAPNADLEHFLGQAHIAAIIEHFGGAATLSTKLQAMALEI